MNPEILAMLAALFLQYVYIRIIFQGWNIIFTHYCIAQFSYTLWFSQYVIQSLLDQTHDGVYWAGGQWEGWGNWCQGNDDTYNIV